MKAPSHSPLSTVHSPLIPPGYKQTEVGVIPEDWDARKLGSLCSFTQGVQIPQSEQIRHPRNGYIRYLYIRDFFTDEFPWYVKDQYSSKVMVETDIMMVNTGSTAGMVYTGAMGVLSNNAFRIRFDRSVLTRDFLYAFLTSEKTQRTIREISNAAAQPHVGHKNIAQLPIAVPGTDEQRAIAEALSDVDGLLGGLDRLIAKKRDLKQAAMQQLLTGQTRLPGFRGDWEVKRLGELAEMGSGGTPTTSVPAYYDGEIPWVSISDMTKGGKVIVTTDRNLTRAGFVSCAAQMFPAGTVLYAMYASLGECSIAGVSLCSSQAILGIRTRSSLSNEFLYYYLTSLKPVVKSLGQHGTQANLNKGMVQDFRLRLPPLAEQTAIAEVLTEMDLELAGLEQRREKTRALKQAMMQELLTGRTRLA